MRLRFGQSVAYCTLAVLIFIAGALCARFGFPPYPQLVRMYYVISKDVPQTRLAVDRAALIGAFRADSHTAQWVLAGDSQLARGDWARLLPEHSLAMRAIDGETSAQLLDRADTLRVNGARGVVILIGINDLIQGAAPAAVCANVARLLNTLSDRDQIVLGVLPTSAAGWNQQVQALNICLQTVALQNGTQFVRALPDSAPIAPELTSDGLHLNERGYLKLAGVIRHALKER